MRGGLRRPCAWSSDASPARGAFTLAAVAIAWLFNDDPSDFRVNRDRERRGGASSVPHMDVSCTTPQRELETANHYSQFGTDRARKALGAQVVRVADKFRSL